MSTVYLLTITLALFPPKFFPTLHFILQMQWRAETPYSSEYLSPTSSNQLFPGFLVFFCSKFFYTFLYCQILSPVSTVILLLIFILCGLFVEDYGIQYYKLLSPGDMRVIQYIHI